MNFAKFSGVNYLQRVKGRPASQICSRSLSKNWETYLTLTQAQGILPTLPLDWSKYAPNAKPIPELRKKEGEQRAEYFAQKTAMINQSVEIIRIPQTVGFLFCPPPDQLVATKTIRDTLDELDKLHKMWVGTWVDNAMIGELYGFVDRLQPLPKMGFFQKLFGAKPKSNRQAPEQPFSEPEESRQPFRPPLKNYVALSLLPSPHSGFLRTPSVSVAIPTKSQRDNGISKEKERQIESVNQAAQVCRDLFAPWRYWRYIERNDDMSIQAGDIMDSISGSVNRRLNTGLEVLTPRHERVWQRIAKNKDISLTMFFLKPLLGAIPFIRSVKSNEELLYAEVSETSVRYVEEEVSEVEASQLARDITFSLSGASPEGTPRDRPQLIVVVRRINRACWVHTGDLKTTLGARSVDISSLQVSSTEGLVHFDSGRKMGEVRCQERGPGSAKVAVLTARDGRLVTKSERLDSEDMEGWHMTEDDRLAQTISYKLEEESPENQEATIYDIAKHFFDHSILGPQSSVLRCVVDNYDYTRSGGIWPLE